MSRQDSLYLLSENRLERLALQTLQQETLAEFSGQADLLYPTAHQDLWILGARGDFSLMLEPLPASDYYLLDLTRPQTPDLRPCALEQTADQETIASKQQRFVLGAEAKQLQPTVLFCP